MNIDWSDLKPKTRKPTKRERALYNKWRKYLSDSKLSIDEQHIRAAAFASNNRKVPQ